MSTFPTVEEYIAKGLADAQRADMMTKGEPADPLHNFICFVSCRGETKRICRHEYMADHRDDAAKYVANHCTLANEGIEVQVEVFVHAGTLYQYELTEQEGKK